MIDIKAISKPRQGGSSSSSVSVVQSAATASTAKRADVADKAIYAERATYAESASMAQRSSYASTAEEAAHAAEADHALKADDAEAWQGESFAAWLDQPVRKADGVAFASLASSEIRSAATVVDGFAGSGFHLRQGSDGVARLDVDELTVRQTMRIMELLIGKIRSVGGQIVASAANGKVKEVRLVGDAYVITWETDNMFQPHDLMRCQTFTGTQPRSYWVEVQSVMADGVVVAASEFGSAEPQQGDECVLMGNTLDTSRQGMALISATDDGAPRFDVMDGICSKTLSGCLHARLGKLDGISDAAFPADSQPQGYGLYADNAYLKGTFVLSTGEDVLTRLKATEGKIESSVESIRQDLTAEKGYLANSDFSSGLSSWTVDTGAVFFVAGGRWIITGDKPLASPSSKVAVVKDQGRTAVRIRSSYIQQNNADMASRPQPSMGEGGKYRAVPVYVSFFYRCVKGGWLTLGFSEDGKDEYEEYVTLGKNVYLSPTDGYERFDASGFWNGKGLFVLNFTGEIYISMLVVSSDKVESLAYKYKTLFAQSDTLVKIAAQNFDRDGNVIAGSGIVMTADFTSLFTRSMSEYTGGSGLVTTATFGSLFSKSFDEATGGLDMSAVVTTANFGSLFSKSFDEATGGLDMSAVVTTANFGSLFSKSFDESINSSSMAGFVTTSDFDRLSSSVDDNTQYVKQLLGQVSNISGKLDGKVDVVAFSDMFAEAKDKDTDIVKRADIATFITKDYDGFMQSNAIIKADQIKLEGLVTANSNFKILTDGSIEASNAKLKGYLYTLCRNLADSDSQLTSDGYRLRNNLCVDATFSTVLLPMDTDYEGARALIMDTAFHKTRTFTNPTIIKTVDGSPMLGGVFSTDDSGSGYADTVVIDAGTIELVLRNGVGDAIDSSVTYPRQWIVVGCTCRVLQWSYGGKAYEREFWSKGATSLDSLPQPL